MSIETNVANWLNVYLKKIKKISNIYLTMSLDVGIVLFVVSKTNVKHWWKCISNLDNEYLFKKYLKKDWQAFREHDILI